MLFGLRTHQIMCNIIEFTGKTTGSQFIHFKVIGNPFPSLTNTIGKKSYHIKPNNVVFEEYRNDLTDYEKYMISSRKDDGFTFDIKDLIMSEDGDVIYSNLSLKWTTRDGYNIDISTQSYQRFLESLLNIGSKYDSIKTDLISRFLTTTSLKNV